MPSRSIVWSNWPLALRLTVTMTLVILFAVAGVTTLGVQREQETSRAELEHQATLLLDVLTIAVADPLYKLDVGSIAGLLGSLSTDQIVVAGRVYDRDGKIIGDVHERAAVLSTRSDPFGERVVASDEVVIEWQSDRLIVGKAVIVGRDRIGAVSVGLSTAPLVSTMAMIRLQGFTVGLIVVLIGVVLAFLVSRSITGPLRELMGATGRVSGGNLAEPIPIRGRDELAALARAFNAMVDQLRATLAHQDRQQQLLAEKNQQLELMLAEIAQAHTIQASLSQTISNLSTPVLHLAEQVVLMPLVGRIDGARVDEMQERMLAAIERTRARVAIIDVTGVPLIDTEVASAFIQTSHAVRLLGARIIICGIMPEVAQTLVSSAVEFGGLAPAADLQSALRTALGVSGRGATG